MDEIMSIDMLGTGTVKIGNLEYIIENYSQKKQHISTSTNKLLVYAILRMRMIDSESNFSLNEYMEFRNLSDFKNAKESIKKDLRVLQSILNISYTSKNGNIQYTTCIVTGTNYHYGKIKIVFNKNFAKQLKKNYMYIHENLIKIKYPLSELKKIGDD